MTTQVSLTEPVIAEAQSVGDQLIEQPAAPTRVQSPMRTLALKVEWYIDYMMRRAQTQGEDLKLAWERVVVTLALFNIQLQFKNKPETYRSGKWYTFFVSHGAPRPMSSFRLHEDKAEVFKTLTAPFRAMISRSFAENRHWLNQQDEPYSDFLDQAQRMEAEELAAKLHTTLAKE